MPLFRRPSDAYDDAADPRMRRHGFKILPLVLFAMYAVYYWTSHQQTVPVTGRSQLVDIDRETEAALGLQSYREVLQQSSVISSGPEARMVEEVGRRIAQVADDPGFEWEFRLLNSDEKNAFCLPGGKVAVYSGILPIAANENGLAVIMAHEIAHAIARHGAERMAQERLAQYGQLALGASMSDMDQGTRRGVMQAFGLGAQFGFLLPFSREHESEADKIGLIYMSRACFDPREAPRLWERMQREANSGQPLEFMSTHPSHETRIEQFNEWMPEAIAEYEAHCGRKLDT